MACRTTPWTAGCATSPRRPSTACRAPAAPPSTRRSGHLLWDRETYGGACAGSPSLRRFDAPIFSADDDPDADTLSGWARFTIGGDEAEDGQALEDLLDWLDDGDQPDLEVTHTTFDGKSHKAAQKQAFEACLEELANRW